MTEAEAIDLVAKAIRSGIFNDLGSGSNVDLCVISEGGKKVDYKRNYELLQGKTYSRQQPVIFEKGTARELSPNRARDPRCDAAVQHTARVGSSAAADAVSELGFHEHGASAVCPSTETCMLSSIVVYHGCVVQWTLWRSVCIGAQHSCGVAAAVSGERVHKIIPLDALHIIEGEPADAVGMDIE